MTAIDPEVLAKTYLSKLTEEITLAKTHLEIAEKINGYIDTHAEAIDLAPGFWSFTRSAHIDEGLMTLSRLIDKRIDRRNESFTLYYFLDFINSNPSLFSKSTFQNRLEGEADPYLISIVFKTLPDNVISESVELNKTIDEQFAVLFENLKVWRDKYLAHTDLHFLKSGELETLSGDYPIIREQAFDAINKIGELVDRLSIAFNGVTNTYSVGGLIQALDGIISDLAEYEVERKKRWMAANDWRKHRTIKTLLRRLLPQSRRGR